MLPLRWKLLNRCVALKSPIQLAVYWRPAGPYYFFATKGFCLHFLLICNFFIYLFSFIKSVNSPFKITYSEVCGIWSKLKNSFSFDTQNSQGVAKMSDLFRSAQEPFYATIMFFFLLTLFVGCILTDSAKQSHHSMPAATSTPDPLTSNHFVDTNKCVIMHSQVSLGSVQ